MFVPTELIVCDQPKKENGFILRHIPKTIAFVFELIYMCII